MTTLDIPTEAEVQRAVLQVLALHGWRTWRIGQWNARRTQDAGVPDIVAMHDRHGLLWVEVKRPGGKQSGAQRSFEAACVAAGVRYWLISSSTDLHRRLTDMARQAA